MYFKDPKMTYNHKIESESDFNSYIKGLLGENSVLDVEKILNYDINDFCKIFCAEHEYTGDYKYERDEFSVPKAEDILYLFLTDNYKVDEHTSDIRYYGRDDEFCRHYDLYSFKNLNFNSKKALAWVLANNSHTVLEIIDKYNQKPNKNNYQITYSQMKVMQEALKIALEIECKKYIKMFQAGKISKLKFDSYVSKYKHAKEEILPKLDTRWRDYGYQITKIYNKEKRKEIYAQNKKARAEAIAEQRAQIKASKKARKAEEKSLKAAAKQGLKELKAKNIEEYKRVQRENHVEEILGE